MEYTIRNEHLTVCVSEIGGELMSIRSADGTEYLWQGDSKYWAGRSPNLFPFVGRLEQGRYTLNGQSYELTIHGFVRRAQLQCERHSEQSLWLRLTDSEETRKVYPCAFEYRIGYTLNGSTLEVEYAVNNSGAETMHFGIGAHPGFNVPLSAGARFEDYYLEFAEAHTPDLEVFSDACLMTGTRRAYPLVENRRLPLSHNLFDQDALVFSSVNRSVTLKTDKDSRFVRVDYPQMPYLGLWHKPQTDAPYLCIEPWVSLPGNDGEITALETKEDLVSLKPGKQYRNQWNITIG